LYGIDAYFNKGYYYRGFSGMASSIARSIH